MRTEITRLILTVIGLTLLLGSASATVHALSWGGDEDLRISKHALSPGPIEVNGALPRCTLETIQFHGHAEPACKMTTPTLTALGIDPQQDEKLFIQKHDDIDPYPLDEPINDSVRFYLSEKSDIMVIAHKIPPSNIKRIDVYKNFSQLLTLATDADGNAVYTLPDQPTFTLKMPSGDIADTMSGILSDNGIYFVTQIQGLGMARINLNTFKTELFSRDHYLLHDYARHVMAVSDDGNSVAIIEDWPKQSVMLYMINQACVRQGLATPTESTLCVSVDVGSRVKSALGLQPDVYTMGLWATLPRYTSNDEVAIGVYLANDSIYADLRIAGLPGSGGKLKYLALGDSYTSGEGDIADLPRTHYLPGTQGKDQCHLSDRSYPYLLRDKWGIAPSQMQSVACSGARVQPDFYSSVTYNGQHGDLAGKSEVQRSSLRQKALYNFTPGVVQQLDFVRLYQPDIMTFTGGGNDIGFANILGYCAMPGKGQCAYATKGLPARADLNHLIDTQYTPNMQLIQKAKEASPATKIYMVGYPQFVSKGLLCVGFSGLLDDSERTMIRESVTRFNNILKKVARDAGVYYVDIEDSLAGGQVCDGSRYMTGPIRMAIQNWSLDKDQNMYHPNHLGHIKIADAIAQKIASGMDYQILDIPAETNGRRIVRTAVLPDYAGVGSTHMITMDPSMFLPDGRVTIEMFSQPTMLGTATAGSDGSLHTSITIPRSIGIGTHLLTISGEDSEGQPVVVQQYVTIISDIPGDADADGIPDDEDNCFVITEWYQDGKNLCESAPGGTTLTTADRPGSTSSITTTALHTGASSSHQFALSSQGMYSSTSSHTGDAKPSVASTSKPDKTAYETSWWILSIISIIAIGAATYYATSRLIKTK